jgi:hypothetical protein
MSTSDLSLGELAPGDPEYADSPPIDAKADEGDRCVVVIVHAPKDVNPKRFRFLLEETVGEAAKVAAASFGYHVGNPSFQIEDGTVLDRAITLRAARVQNLEKLELADAGGGV